ncbi:hypothetical protein N7492_007905 [Penicillium capsulatum]|uniref:Uncharacterized protein n=1 Tax=Penicillium capsulatum TaxID=69766 RepID=A0A9W9LMA2_9EURO|nr:hypothetical protein N7492_007905 [Penicillium capsulatum]
MEGATLLVTWLDEEDVALAEDTLGSPVMEISVDEDIALRVDRLVEDSATLIVDWLVEKDAALLVEQLVEEDIALPDVLGASFVVRISVDEDIALRVDRLAEEGVALPVGWLGEEVIGLTGDMLDPPPIMEVPV